MASRLQDVILRGTAASRPVATTVAPGTLYYSTDTSTTDRCADTGLTWETYADGGAAAAPAGASYVTLATNGTLTSERVLTAGTGITLTDAGAGSTVTIAASGGGGNVTSTGAEASKPGSPAAGDLYLPNDGFVLERSTGSAWVPWGPLFPLTDPTLAGLSTWVNQGGATVSSVNGGITLTAPATSGDSFRMRVKTAPATPYVITAMLLGMGAPIAGSFGLVFRESSSSKLHLAMIGGSVGGFAGLLSIKFTSETVFSATYTSNQLVQLPVPTLQFLRIADTGTNRTISLSSDGVNFMQWHSIGRTDFLTANQVGFFANSGSSSLPAMVTLVSWKET